MRKLLRNKFNLVVVKFRLEISDREDVPLHDLFQLPTYGKFF
jgi:hypothetical protein